LLNQEILVIANEHPLSEERIFKVSCGTSFIIMSGKELSSKEQIEIALMQPAVTDAGTSKKKSRSDRKKPIPTKIVKTQLCKYFKRGQCTKGDACSFSHEYSHTQRLALEKARTVDGLDDIAAAAEAKVCSDLDNHLNETCTSSMFVMWAKNAAESLSSSRKHRWYEMSDEEDENGASSCIWLVDHGR